MSEHKAQPITISNLCNSSYFYSLYCSFSATDSNVTLLRTVMGGDSVTPTEVALVEASGLQIIIGTLEKIADGDFLVTMNSVPAGEFVIRVMGERISSRSSNDRFQRQSVTPYRASSVVITVSSGFLTLVKLILKLYLQLFIILFIHLGLDR